MASTRTVGIGLMLMATLLSAGTARATTAIQKCQGQKLKARGKLEFCLQKNSAKVLEGGTDAAGTCKTKFQTALSRVDNSGVAAGTTACRYLDNGDDTVTDLNTGLQWEKKRNWDDIINNADPHDADNFYTWSASGSATDGTTYTDFLAKLNNGTSTDGGASTAITGCFAGHCDWRVPTIVELNSIVDVNAAGCNTGGTCIDAAFGPTAPPIYWSATTTASDPTIAWFVDFDYGGVGDAVKSTIVRVRAVRGGL